MMMNETEEERAERERKKRKRISDASSEALKKLAKEERRACITDLPDELFNRNIVTFLDLESIKTLVMDEPIDETLRVSDYWCVEHGCFFMDNGGGMADLELSNKVDEDGLDGEMFLERLNFRNTGDWVVEASRPDKLVLLDFDPIYRPYLLLSRRCPRCEIHAMKLVLEGMPTKNVYPQCKTCLRKFKHSFVTMFDCGTQNCTNQVCRRCSKLTCIHCDRTFCKTCSFYCDKCRFMTCLDCTDILGGDNRWVRECSLCGYGICDEANCDPDCVQVYFCHGCSTGKCSGCMPGTRCHCDQEHCNFEYLCNHCFVSCGGCGRTFRKGHVQACNQCGEVLQEVEDDGREYNDDPEENN